MFSTRSPDRPNPVGLHRVEIVSIDDARVRMRNLEALDGTPTVDLKPVLGQVPDFLWTRRTGPPHQTAP